jgi:hypothetical protein
MTPVWAKTFEEIQGWRLNAIIETPLHLERLSCMG